MIIVRRSRILKNVNPQKAVKPPLLEWKRAVKTPLDTAVMRTIDSKCGTYRVNEFTERIGNEPDYCSCWRFRARDGIWFLFSNHRVKKAALAACEKDAKQRQKAEAA